MARRGTGADQLCSALADGGVETVFGVPGTQSIDLWDALRRRETPGVLVATNELSAGFMANGYARGSGRVGVFVTIPGPGFTYGLTALAEAKLDSAPVLHIAGAPARRDDGAPALQAIAQAEIAAPLVKRVINVESAEEVGPAVADALGLAAAGEPGPVLLQLPEQVLGSPAGEAADEGSDEPPLPELPEDALRAIAERLASASRPLLYCGQGAQGASEHVQAIAEGLRAPVLTTTSGRGVIPEESDWSLPFDSPGSPTTALNQLLAEADLVLAVGVKLSHNGSFGYTLRLASGHLVRIDSSAGSAAYPASLEVEADAGRACAWLAASLGGSTASTWQQAELDGWRKRLNEAAASVAEPELAGRPAAAFFADLRSAMPDRAVLTTDSGLHQYMARRHFRVRSRRTFLVPANFQSMGFGLPAAIGAAVATGQPAAVVLGDGGFAIGGLELATAVRAGVPLVAIVLVDGSYGLIRLQQLRRTGRESGVDLPPIDVKLVAEAVGASYARIDERNALPVLEGAFGSGGVWVVEVGVESDRVLGRARIRGIALSAAQSAIGQGASGRLVDSVRRRRT